VPADFNYMIGGEAGQGVQSVASLLGKVMARSGYHVFIDHDYESRVRGGHNFTRVRLKDGPTRAIDEAVDVLVALNEESIHLHLGEVVQGGAVVYDSEKLQQVPSDSRLLGLPLERIAVETGGNRIMTNTVALGAALALVGFDTETLSGVLTDHFKGGDVAAKNILAATAGYDQAKRIFKGAFPHIRHLSNGKRMLLSGADAITLGAMAAGCRFVAGYPMTPTTSILEVFAEKAKDLGGVMVPAEDEIAAIHMAIGASYAGVRAMTATSGGGFCLMVEGLGLAGMTETPVVVVEGQRAGPAIGLPTRTEQGDLLFLLHAAHGEFPRAVLAPTSIEDCFWSTVRAFNLADRYQVPVLVLIDHFIASSLGTTDGFDLSQVTIDRGQLYSEEGTDPSTYLRHRITDSGVSPRGIPGAGKALVVTDSDEHDEAGHLTEDAATRKAQMDKRLRKLSLMAQETVPPVTYGTSAADVLLVGWGSTFGTLQETVDLLSGEMSIGLLQFSQVWPFPTEAAEEAMAQAQSVYVVENNATGQLARLIKSETGRTVSGKVLRYDGRPFTPAFIANAIRKEVSHGDSV
jgi:2-oxoglutarate/2-oxoacid ferredoxin oxidoreductase subunit alpha